MTCVSRTFLFISEFSDSLELINDTIGYFSVKLFTGLKYVKHIILKDWKFVNGVSKRTFITSHLNTVK